MPTQHVEPGSDEHLQDVANALFKARKVVVVTGAGISTNSGIPVYSNASLLHDGNIALTYAGLSLREWPILAHPSPV
jgi:accessory colonization factor AcfC